MKTRSLTHAAAIPWFLLVYFSAMFGIGCRGTPAPDSGPTPVILTKKTDTASATTETPASPRFAIQVGAFEKKDDADKLAFQLSNRYQKPVFLTPTKVGDREFYRVRILVGTQAEANALAVGLSRNEKLNVWVVEFP